MDGSDKKSPFTVYIAEGDKLYKAGDYKKAIEAFSDAIQLEPDNASTFVYRSKCYLAMGNAKLALDDAEHSLKNNEGYHRGIYQKAEALYSLGQFEYALVFYHRGQKIRPELDCFRLGVQKAKEAIINSVGTPKSVNLRSKTGISESVLAGGKEFSANNMGRMSTAQSNIARGELRRGTLAGNVDDANLTSPLKNSTSAGARSHSGRGRHSTAGSSEIAKKQKTAKAVLGEIYPDKAFLMKLLEDEELMKGHASNGMNIQSLIMSGLNYLDTRTDFWQQHKPIYARKRDKLLMQQQWNQTKKMAQGSEKNKQKEILTILEKAEKFIEENNPIEALKELNILIKTCPIDEHSSSNACQILGLLGLAQVDIGNFTEALKNHKQELKIAEKNNLSAEKSRALDNLGRVYARLGKFDKAIEAWTIKLPLAENDLEKTWLHHELGRCYFEMGNNEKAVEHGTQSFAFAEAAVDSTWQINSKVLLAEAFQKSGDNEQAVNHFQEALKLSQFYNDEPAQLAIKNALKGLSVSEE